jgi:hypothetical protein
MFLKNKSIVIVKSVGNVVIPLPIPPPAKGEYADRGLSSARNTTPSGFACHPSLAGGEF